MSAFEDAIGEIVAMHNRKQADYGREGDPFSNVRSSEDFGVPAWVGCMIRANDKMRRLQKAAMGHSLLNESIEDSLLDLAVYSIIGLVLYREVRPFNPMDLLKTEPGDWHALEHGSNE